MATIQGQCLFYLSMWHAATIQCLDQIEEQVNLLGNLFSTAIVIYSSLGLDCANIINVF